MGTGEFNAWGEGGGGGVGGEKPCDGLASHPAENRYTPGHFILEGLNGVNRQPSNGQKINRQP